MVFYPLVTKQWQSMIEGKIAGIVNSTDVIMNKGGEDGVKPEMTFQIYSYGEEIVDPETNESLGQVENVKADTKVKHIQDRMTILTSSETTQKTTGLTIMSQMRSSQVVQKDITNEDEDYRNESKHVIRGDHARQTNSDS